MSSRNKNGCQSARTSSQETLIPLELYRNSSAQSIMKANEGIGALLLRLLNGELPADQWARFGCLFARHLSQKRAGGCYECR
jgi:hypothetical protein